MKYKKSKWLTNLIVLLLSASVFCSACGGEEMSDEESASDDLSSEESFVSEPEKIVFTKEDAILLVRNDRQLTEIFVCNSLCDKSITEAKYQSLPAENEFSSFAAIEELLNLTYSSHSSEKSFFLQYPFEDLPSVVNEEGRTSVFYHPGSKYEDFLDEPTVYVTESDVETEKAIYAKTLSGREVKLDVVLEDGKWLLKNGIYSANPPAETEFSEKFSKSSSGSLKTLSGNILVIELLVSDAETSITEEEKQVFHGKVVSALEGITSKCADYGTDISFDYQTSYFDHENTLGDRVLDFDLMYAETGFGTLQNLAESDFNVDDYDGYFFTVFIDKDIETSAGVYDSAEENEIYYGERILMGNSAAAEEITASLLAAAGAYNYCEGVLDNYTESLCQSYFPDDIMVGNGSEISPVTAYSCGITDKLNGLYRIFIPKE